MVLATTMGKANSMVRQTMYADWYFQCVYSFAFRRVADTKSGEGRALVIDEREAGQKVI